MTNPPDALGQCPAKHLPNGVYARADWFEKALGMLLPYAQHKLGCYEVILPAPQPCTCGLSALRAALAEVKHD